MIVQATNTLASTPDRFYLFSWKYSRGEDESVVPENEIIGESSVFILAHFKNSSSLKSLEEDLVSKEEKEEEEHFYSSWIFCEIKKEEKEEAGFPNGNKRVFHPRLKETREQRSLFISVIP